MLVLQHVCAPIANIFFGYRDDCRGLGDPIDVEERSQDHSDFDGDGEIRQNGERESCSPDRDVGLGEPDDRANLAPFAHVIGPYLREKNGGQSS